MYTILWGLDFTMPGTKQGFINTIRMHERHSIFKLSLLAFRGVGEHRASSPFSFFARKEILIYLVALGSPTPLRIKARYKLVQNIL
ncbi:MAG: hypothetical protein JWN14_652 [Chthonomonadales bacterium]|nr:hypothetical protein [Chthonomonadales bacterium]